MSEPDLESLRLRLEDLDVEVASTLQDTARLTVSPERASELFERLRDEPETSMRRLVDLTAIDRGGHPRFEVVYRLHSPGLNERLRVHVPVPEEEAVLDSVVPLWPAANWLEREVFDLFGIRFRGHPDLRRILLAADFDGAPLRKDYPRQPNLDLPKAVEP